MGPIIAGLVGLGMSLADRIIADKRQRKQQQRLNEDAMKQQKEMAEYNQQLGMKTWEETNYSAQRQQMMKAGINPGLMYGGTQSGGSYVAGDAKGPDAAKASNEGILGMGLQIKAQLELMKAQKDNIEADTAVKKRDAGVPVKEATEAETGLNIQKTENAKLDNAILGWEEKIRQIEYKVKNDTSEDAVEAIRNANDITEQEIRKSRADADIKEGTRDELIKQINQASREQALRIAGQQKGLIKTDAEIKSINEGVHKMAQEINNMIQGNMREWDKLSNEQKRTAIEEKIMEIGKQNSDFNTSTPQQVRQWTDLIMSVLTLGIGAQGGSSAPAGFKLK